MSLSPRLYPGPKIAPPNTPPWHEPVQCRARPFAGASLVVAMYAR
jgi:hypothetical protein